MSTEIKIGEEKENVYFLFNVWTMRTEHEININEIQKIINELLENAIEERKKGEIDKSNNTIKKAELIAGLYNIARCASRKWKRCYNFNG